MVSKLLWPDLVVCGRSRGAKACGKSRVCSVSGEGSFGNSLIRPPLFGTFETQKKPVRTSLQTAVGWNEAVSWAAMFQGARSGGVEVTHTPCSQRDQVQIRALCYILCDHGQVALPLWVSVSLLVMTGSPSQGFCGGDMPVRKVSSTWRLIINIISLPSELEGGGSVSLVFLFFNFKQ